MNKKWEGKPKWRKTEKDVKEGSKNERREENGSEGKVRGWNNSGKIPKRQRRIWKPRE